MADSKVTMQCDPAAERAAWILSWVHKDGDKTLKYFLQLQKKYYASLDKTFNHRDYHNVSKFL